MLPWPHIVSRTGVTVCVCARASVRVFASRVRASGRGVWFVLPGLGGLSILVFSFVWFV